MWRGVEKPEGAGYRRLMPAEEERLFALLDDLEQQAEGAFQDERTAEVADRGVREYAAVSLASRLMASTGRLVSLDVVGVGSIEAHLEQVAQEWCVLADPRVAGSWLVRLAAITTVAGASERSVPEVAWPVTSRLGLGSALRRLADDGRCVLHLRDGRVLECSLGRVGADFVEARVAADAEIGSGAAQDLLVPYAALAAVHRPG